MTNDLRRAPQHGGLQRVAFDGGSNVRGELPFNALSVNVDNWSPYWYKLNPIEEYIPPFQHGINIKLPLIHSYEFVCQAPPGIVQSIIVATTGVPGNTNPIIAVFSSFDTNNDAGFNAIQASANKISPISAITGTSSIDTDLSLYDGLYLNVLATTHLLISIIYKEFPAGITTVYRRVMYANMRLFFVIPKVSRLVSVQFAQDPNNITAVTATYTLRPYIGVLPFSVAIQPPILAGSLSPTDRRNTTGETTVTFSTYGIDNAVLSVIPNGGAGVTNNTVYWIKVFVSNYNNISSALLYSRAFKNPVNPAALLLPINGLLARQIDEITVFIRPSEAGATLATANAELSMHQGVAEALDTSGYDPVVPFTQVGAIAPAAGVQTILVTLPFGGMLTAMTLTVLVPGAAGTNVQINIGTGAAQIVSLGLFSAAVVSTIPINIPVPIRLDNGFNTLWIITTAAAGTFAWYISLK